MVVATIGWNEDIDLSGGAAAIAALGGQIPVTLSGTDQIVMPNYTTALKRIWWTDETAGGTGGYISITGRVRPIRFGKDEMATDPLIGMIEFPGRGILLEKGAKLDCVGNASGSGAENHCVLLDVEFPQLPRGGVVPHASAMNALYKECPIVGLKTGTLTAATVSGNSTIIGSVNAYEDSAQIFAEDPSGVGVLYGILPTPGGAGYSVCGFRHPSGQYHWLRPAIMAAAASTPPFYMIDGAWRFTFDSAPILVGAGVGTTSTEFVPLWGVLNYPQGGVGGPGAGGGGAF